jgi:hypothetical protein
MANEQAKLRLLQQGCVIVKDEPDFPRYCVKDPFGLIYNLATETSSKPFLTPATPPHVEESKPLPGSPGP